VSSIIRVRTGEVTTLKDDIQTVIDGTDQYNPHLYTMTARGRRQLHSASLRDLTDAGAMEGIAAKLADGLYDDPTLIRVALELLERRKEKLLEEPEKIEIQEGGTSALPLGEQAQVIGIEKTQPNKARLCGGFIARVALATTVFVGVTGIAGRLIDGINPPSIPIALPNHEAQIQLAGRGGNEGAIRVDDHGLMQTSAYWHQDINYDYTRKGWRGDSSVPWEPIVVPAVLSPKTPHLTVTFFSDEQFAYGNFSMRYAANLPVEGGTKIGALRAFDADNKPLRAGVALREDGLAIGYLLDQPEGYDSLIIRYEYDLVSSTEEEWDVHPQRPIYVSNGATIKDPGSIPGAKQGTRGLANYTKSKFEYDDSDPLKRIYAKRASSPGSFVSEVYSRARGNCAEVNAAVAMVSSQLWPEQHLGFVGGYNHYRQSNFGHDYLQASEAHGWLSNGGAIDSTPTKGGGVSAPTLTEQELDKTWQQAVGTPIASWEPPAKELPVWPVLGLLATAVIAGELRHRRLANIVGSYLRWDRWMTSHMDIDPRDALQIMNWSAYGGPNSAMPLPSGGKAYRGEVSDNVPDYILDDIISGQKFPGLTRAQQRGVKHMAAALKADRRHEARQKLYKQASRKSQGC
jgi:hypothetical protein